MRFVHDRRQERHLCCCAAATSACAAATFAAASAAVAVAFSSASWIEARHAAWSRRYCFCATSKRFCASCADSMLQLVKTLSAPARA